MTIHVLWVFIISMLLFSSSASADIKCYECHGTKIDEANGDYRPVDAPYRNITTGGFPGSHRSHLSAPSTPDACAKCHSGSEGYSQGHSNRVISLSANINNSPVSGEYRDGSSKVMFKNQTSMPILGTCTNVNCHFESETPRWGGRFTLENPCSSCHGAPPQDKTHKTHHNVYGPTTNSCTRCHTDHANEKSPYAHASSAGRRRIAFRNISYSKPENTIYPNYLPSRIPESGREGGTCNNVSCHRGTKATWGGGACLDCHSVPQGNRAAITGQFSSNSHHVQGTAITDAHCYQCHWEANSDGSINSDHHASQTTGSPVKLVIYSSGQRPSAFVDGKTGITYTPNGTRGEIQKITSHCIGCHSDQNNDTRPFGDGKTPKQYAWDGSSVAARYGQTGTAAWGKYSTANGANKKIAKAYSAHGNAAANSRGWNVATGVDGAITDTSGAANVQCYDCHNSHGSSVSGRTTRYVSATPNGGILKDTTTGSGGYSIAYKPYTGGSAVNKNRRNPGASLCLDCHMNKTASSTPWGYTSTYGAASPILGYWDLPFMGISTSGAVQRFPYKKESSLGMKGGHFGASRPLSNPASSNIDGLCTPCHDPHGVSPTIANQEFAVPLLKGTWLTSPYREDKAPKYNQPLTNRADLKSRGVGGMALEGLPYNIDQNTFGANIKDPVTGVTQTAEQFGGLCLQCHNQGSLTGASHDWKSKDRIHESVKGWKVNGTVKHTYSCSKCHSAHTNSLLPRLMVTNCLDSKHKGRTGWTTPAISGSGAGHAAAFDYPYTGHGGVCDQPFNLPSPYCIKQILGFGYLQGQGSGRLPGNFIGGGSNYRYVYNDVACHEGQTGAASDQGWNTVTPWYPTLALNGGPYVSVSNGQTTVSWWTNLNGSTTVKYRFDKVSAYTTVTGASGTMNHSVTFPNSASFYYQVGTVSTDGQQLVSQEYAYDIDPPNVVSFTVTTPSPSSRVQITSFIATDNVGVTGYQVTTSSSPPSGGTTYGWLSTPPASYTLPALGSYTLYPWVRDAAGNVSSLYGLGVTVTAFDATPPDGVANLSPADNSVNLPTNTLLFSTAASDIDSSSVQYLFQLSTGIDFASGTVQESGWQRSTSYAPRLASDTTYYWRVKARDVAVTPNETPFTLPWSFRTGSPALWTYKGDFENNLNMTSSHPATVVKGLQISGPSQSDDASVGMSYRDVVSGKQHTLAVRGDGTVWGWGYNGYGQVGDGTTTHRYLPVQVKLADGLPLTDVSAVAAGGNFSLALKNGGTVWAWGYNGYGQLGDGTTTQRITPVQVITSEGTPLSGIVSLFGGSDHAIALKEDGTVWTWGYNGYGQLGDGLTANNSRARQLPNFSGVFAIAAGSYHSLAVKADGTVWGWGKNSSYQLGDGTSTSYLTTPVQVREQAGGGFLDGAVAVSAGDEFTVALKSDGTVWSWGYGFYGQLGIGSAYLAATAVQVKNTSGSGFLTDITAISAGNQHVIALKSDGTVWSWGNNYNYGQVGDGTGVNRNLPVQVPGLSGIETVSAGSSHSMALRTADRSLWMWGSNDYGQLGINGSTTQLSPIQAQGGVAGAASVTAAGSHSLSINPEDGSIWAWGANSRGQLGDGTTATRTIPVKVRRGDGSHLTGAIAVSAGYEHSLALLNDGTVWAWGYNSNGQLGDGTSTQRNTPVLVSGLSGIVAIAAGSYHSLALKSDGTVWAWGYNGYGLLGDGTATNRTTPVQSRYASGVLTGVQKIAAGTYHSLAIKSDGTVWAWGYNNYGQIGDNTTTQRTTAVQVLAGAKAIACGENHSLAVKTDGKIWAWGGNSSGQLGDGTTTQRNVPVLAQGSGWSGVAAGSYFSLAYAADESVWGWGSNSSGQLGNGSVTNSSVPVQVVQDGGFLSGAIGVAAGYGHSLALRKDGTVWGWGNNGGGQLGTGFGRILVSPGQGIFTGGASAPVGTLSGLKFDAGSPVIWKSSNWNSLLPGNAPNIRFRSRGAANDTPEGWAAANWSDYYDISGSTLTTTSSRWIELELTILGSGILKDVSVSYQTLSQQSDTDLPNSALLSPPDGASIDRSVAGVSTITGTASDSNGIVQLVQVSTDNGATWQNASCTNCLARNVSWKYDWNLPGDGNYTIRSRAIDVAGNMESPSAGNRVTVGYASDITPPASAIETPLAGATLNFAAANPYPLFGFASDHIAVQGVEVSTNGGNSWSNAVCTGCPGKSVTWSYGWPKPLDGTYTILSRATDSSGNREEPASGRTVTTVSMTAAPTSGSPTALSTTSIQWNFTDNANNESGFKLHDPSHAIKVSPATPDIASIVETGLTANTQYTRHIHAYNGAGDSPASGNAIRWTLPVPANVTSDKAASTTVWYNSSTFTFTNAATFGSGGMKGYQYKWDQNPVATTYNSTWESGTLAKTATAAGAWYLHLQPYNGENATNGAVDLGPFYYDGTVPQLTAFTAGETNGLEIPISMTASDNIGVTGYLITTYSSQPYFLGSEWTATPPTTYNVTIGSYTLYPWAKDAAGNVSALYSSPITVMVPPVGVNNLSPANDGISNQNLPTNTRLSCTGASNAQYDSAAQYFFQISTDSAFTPGATQESGWLDNRQFGVSFAPTLLPNMTYYWRVKARQTSLTTNESQFTDAWSFTTANTLLWTYKGDFERNARTVGTATITDPDFKVTGEYPGDDARVTTAFRRVSSEGGHTLAVQPDGSVWAWGVNNYGQLGDNSTTNRLSPVKLTTIDNVTAVAAGAYHSLALKRDGTVWAWGNNSSGQLGNNSYISSQTPVPVTRLGTGIVAIAAGASHSLALKSDGTVWAWGSNGSYLLGSYSTQGSSFVPGQVVLTVGGSTMTGVVAISSKNSTCLAIDSNGKVWSWAGPTAFPNLQRKAVAAAAGNTHSLFLLEDGTVWSIGSNSSGQLGIPLATTSSTNVVRVAGADPTPEVSVVAIAAGNEHSMVLKSDGTVWTWGKNSSGQLGNNSTTLSDIPVQISGLLAGKTVSVIDASDGYSLAVTTGGYLYGTGSNASGQIGTGSTAASVPVPAQSQVTGLVASPVKLSNLRVDAGSPVSWSTLSWNGAMGGNSTVKFRVRGADTAENLGSVPWSAYASASRFAIVDMSNSPLTSRWLEIEVTLDAPTDAAYPRVDDIAVTWLGAPAATDLAPPAVIATTPANGEASITSDMPVSIIWSEPVDCSTVDTASITITPAVGWTRTSCSGSKAVFNVSGQTAQPTTSYTITVGTGVKDLAGNPMASPATFSYSTIPYGGVAYWKFEDPISTDRTAVSSIGTNTGTLVRNAGFIQGKSGNGVKLDGGGFSNWDSVSIGTTGLPAGSSARTIEAWVKTNVGATGYMDILSYGTVATGQGMSFGIYGATSSSGAAYVSAINSPQYTTANYSLNNGSWHHLVFTFASGTAKVYVDGTLVDTKTGITLNTVLNQAKIGTRMDIGEGWYGTIDELIVYNRALSCAEILGQYRRFGATNGSCP